MDASIVLLQKAFRGLSTGRAHPSLLETIRVEVYGDKVPLSHIAIVGSRGGQTLTVSPFDSSLLGKVEKAIFAANLGLTPQRGGTTILVNVPRPDDDQKKKLEARAKELAEAQRVAVRNIRKDARNRAKREDALKSLQKPLDVLTKRKVGEINTALRDKIEAIHWKDHRWN